MKTYNGDLSNRVTTILKRYTPDIEIYSIDESFLKLKGFENYNLREYCLNIRNEVLQSTLIPTC
ncbi:MAG: SOS mutagenesis and repair protein UmuC, partial [Myroides sp.]